MLCDRCCRMKARPPKLTRLAVAINYLLTIAALTSDGVEIAGAACHLILADFANADFRVDTARSKYGFLYRGLILKDEHLLDSFSSVLFPTDRKNYTSSE
jgi:hypothetical protein